MKLEGQHQFAAPRAAVWRALHDPQILANALPGVRSLEPRGDDRYAVTVTVGIGAVKGVYDGTFSLSEQRPPEACIVEAQAGGPPGTVSATASMSLAEDGGGTLLRYEADVAVTGALAGVGQRMVAAAARKTTREFLEAVDRELAGGTPHGKREAAQPAADPAAAEPSRSDVITPTRTPSADRNRELRLLAGGVVLGVAAALIGAAFGRRAAGG